jgi:cobalt-zinc-cadmium resistance protein CzcA
MAMATGTGAEVQRPLATVVIGGILTATFATLAILPTVYGFVHSATMQQNPHVGDRKANAA